MKTWLCALAIVCATAIAGCGQNTNPNAGFALQDGDRVVFYGDSITEQRLYTAFIEEYSITRFPDRKFVFVNSGVGGDKVSGGWAGPIDLRLARDVYAYQPSLVTIMLGMNDGYYQPYDDGIFRTYADGYRHIVNAIQEKLPSARLYFLRPSPHDDVTRAADFDPAYNTTMIRFGDFLATLATEKHAQLVDLNASIVDALTRAKADNPAFSTTLVQDRVHPGTGVHWLMAEAVLKSWNAPSMVSTVALDAARAVTTGVTNTSISDLRKKKDIVSWTQQDRALPLPLPPAKADPFIAEAEKVSDLDDALDREILQVTELAPGSYRLQIDDRPIATFTADQLAAGVNLARLNTPMLQQAMIVALDTELKGSIEGTRFSIAHDARTALDRDAAKQLDSAIQAAVEQQRMDAQPVIHRYVLSPDQAGAVR